MLTLVLHLAAATFRPPALPYLVRLLLHVCISALHTYIVVGGVGMWKTPAVPTSSKGGAKGGTVSPCHALHGNGISMAERRITEDSATCKD